MDFIEKNPPAISFPPLLREKAEQALGDGKRVRPWFMERVCRFLDLDFAPLVDAAEGIEWIHTASLLHDDVVDDDSTRRGKPSYHSLYGRAEAVLFGDYFFLHALRIFQAEKYRRSVFPLLLNTVHDMTEGQIAEAQGTVSTEEGYWSYSTSKTARLFELCAQIPLTYYGKSSPPALMFAQKYGLAFQVADDLSEEDLGKDPLNIQHFMSRTDAVEKFRSLCGEMKALRVIPVEELPFIPFEE
ncbi:MAG: polyprenyl synthetase family protein [archaeon]